MTDPETASAVNNILSSLPLFGEFTLSIRIDETKTSDKEIEDVLNRISQSKANLKAIQWLVENGFAIKRNDLGDKYNKYYQLTEMGRELKMAGSLFVYRSDRLAIQSKRANLDKLAEASFRANRWIAFGTSVAAVYYLLEILRTQYHVGLPCHVKFP